MRTDSEHNDDHNAAPLPAWETCDFFCIHHYAGTGSSTCGWRGRTHEARRDTAGRRWVCPRCGNPTLFRIPNGRAGVPNE